MHFLPLSSTLNTQLVEIIYFNHSPRISPFQSLILAVLSRCCALLLTQLLQKPKYSKSDCLMMLVTLIPR